MSDSIEDFLAVCSPAVRDLAQQLRGLIRRVMPNAIEHVDLPSNIIGYGYDRTYANLICAITPYKAHVSLLFTARRHIARSRAPAGGRRQDGASGEDCDARGC